MGSLIPCCLLSFVLTRTFGARSHPPNQPANNAILAVSTQKRAKWVLADDYKLVECLEHQVSIGNQSDSGFKSTAWSYCARELNKIISEGGEKTGNGCKDHWQQQLKSSYATVDWLLHQASGFGWDPVTSTVTADDDVWTALTQKNSKFSGWRFRSFPLFDRIAALVSGRTADGRDSLDLTEEAPLPADPFETALDSELHGNSAPTNLFHPLAEPEEDLPDTIGLYPPTPMPATPAPMPATPGPTPAPTSIPALTIPALETTPAPTPAPAPISLKRSASVLEAPGPKKKTSRPSGPGALQDVAESVGSLGKTFLKASEDSTAAAIALAAQSTPSRRKRAIRKLEEDSSLSTDEQVRLMCLFRKDAAAADTFLAIENSDTRAAYLKYELENL